MPFNRIGVLRKLVAYFVHAFILCAVFRIGYHADVRRNDIGAQFFRNVHNPFLAVDLRSVARIIHTASEIAAKRGNAKPFALDDGSDLFYIAAGYVFVERRRVGVYLYAACAERRRLSDGFCKIRPEAFQNDSDFQNNASPKNFVPVAHALLRIL